MPAFWYYLFLGAIIQGFILFLVFLAKRKEREANVFLGLLLALMSVQLIQYVIVWWEEVRAYPYFMGMYLYCQFFYGPLLFFYIQKMEGRKMNRLNSFHAIAPGVILALFLFSHLRAPDRVIEFFSWFSTTSFPILLVGAGIISLAYYSVWGILFIRKKKSSSTPMQFRWYRTIVLLFTAYTLSYASYYLVSRWPVFNEYWDYLIALIMSIGLYGIGIMGYFKPQLISDKNLRKKLATSRSFSSSIPTSASASLLSQLEKLMQEERLYQDDLRLEDLSQQLHISRHQLSELINTQLGLSFSDYINQYRVKEARHLLERYPDRSIKEILYDVGFNNRTSFHKHFKKWMGQTPTQYRNQIMAGN